MIQYVIVLMDVLSNDKYYKNLTTINKKGKP